MGTLAGPATPTQHAHTHGHSGSKGVQDADKNGLGGTSVPPPASRDLPQIRPSSASVAEQPRQSWAGHADTRCVSGHSWGRVGWSGTCSYQVSASGWERVRWPSLASDEAPVPHLLTKCFCGPFPVLGPASQGWVTAPPAGPSWSCGRPHMGRTAGRWSGRAVGTLGGAPGSGCIAVGKHLPEAMRRPH